MKKILVVTLMCILESAYSYEYEIEKPLFMGQSHSAHEAITSLALECMNRLGNSSDQPSSCLNGLREIKAYISNKGIVIPSISQNEIPAREILDASSWPDDPTRQGSYYGLKAKINLWLGCENLLGFLNITGHYDNISGGLFCNSHLGVLQFFHSQASSSRTGAMEEYQVTKEKILAWIKLNYEIVMDDEILREPYCGHFNKLKNEIKSYGMAEAFLPKEHEGTLFHCKNLFKLKWIYNNKCSNPFSSVDCDEFGSSYNHQVTAMGAIIHAIQDSYSLSHTKRDECSNGDKKPISKITCAPIQQYYTYSKQDAHKHGRSDVLPIKIDDTCFVSPAKGELIDDAVTATATALWFAAQGKDASKLIEYLESSVFSDPYKVQSPAKTGPTAEGGMCYLKDK